jgi:hypothetical protein
MRRFAFNCLLVVAVSASALWLFGYTRAVWPVAGDSLHAGDFGFLAYPQIKAYRVADPVTGTLSARRLDLFSMSDGPTGIEYNEWYFPCWVVSIGALAFLLGGGVAFFAPGEKRSA